MSPKIDHATYSQQPQFFLGLAHKPLCRACMAEGIAGGDEMTAEGTVETGHKLICAECGDEIL